MGEIKVGERVVCIDATRQCKRQLVVGRDYIVVGTAYPCCYEIVDVGFAPDDDFWFSVCDCGREHYGYTGWYRASRFAPIEEKSETMIESLLAPEEYVLTPANIGERE